MRERWQMNKIGFVNFWLYDDEVFDFADGKLLLRGQNGSGKSITTQSFIPFILDGDRTPSRLDPFGSADRRMEYYFLGDGEKEDSTGYLYLEFKRKNEEEYRTIVIGQRARKNQKMSFWGFVILDGRRIGRDIRLYRSRDGQCFPLNKAEIQKELGEENPFTESQVEYKAMVNRYLFGFSRMDQYEQFIRLLIKVRAPKLSKEFKPTKVYEILNESLQVLSDDDLRSMVEAMEKMDQIQESLEALKRAFKDAQAINKEYNRFNVFMLARKAKNYIEAEKDARESQNKYQKLLVQFEKWKQQKLDCEKNLNHLNSQLTLLKKEIEDLLDPESENMDRKLQNETENHAKLKSQRETKRNQIIDKNNTLKDLEVRQAKYKNDIEIQEVHKEKKIQELNDYQYEIKWDLHDRFIQSIKTNNEIDMNTVLVQINLLQEQVRNGRKAIEEYEKVEKELETLLREIEWNKKEIEKCLSQQENYEQEKEKEQKRLIQCLEQLEDNQFWNVHLETIRKAQDALLNYKDQQDANTIQQILQFDFNEKVQIQNQRIGEFEIDRKQQKQKLDEKKEEYKRIANAKEIEPLRDDDVIQSRNQLKAAGIQYYPFYQTIDFQEDIEESQRAVLEQQLSKANLLDALVVSEQDYSRIKKEFPELLDTFLYVQKAKDTSIDYFVVEPSLPEEIQKIVKNILSSFCYEDGVLVLRKDGYFRHGLLEGYAKKEESEYIGVFARKRKKEQQLAEIQNEIRAIKERIETIDQEISTVKEQIHQMKEEYQKVESCETLNQLMNQIRESQLELEQKYKERNHLEQKQSEFEQLKADKNRIVLKYCKELPYTRSSEAYNIIEQDLSSYKDIFQDLRAVLQELEHLHEFLIQQENHIEQTYSELDTLTLERDNFDREVKNSEILIQRYQDYLNAPERIQKAKQLLEKRGVEKELEEKIRTAEQEKTEAVTRLQDNENTIEERKLESEKASQHHEYVRSYFEEEWNLHYVLKEKDGDLYTNAQQALQLQNKADAEKDSAEMVQMLYSAFTKNNSNLSTYAVSIRNCFEVSHDSSKDERKRVQIFAKIRGKEVGLLEFENELKKDIEETELLIQQKDRQLFEDILSQTISQKLTDRIYESREWVHEMSNLMKNMDTSMGLSFSLDWRPREVENSDELNIKELEKLLTTDKNLITNEDQVRVAKHFRSIIQKEKQRQEMSQDHVNYMDLVRDALDYRKWFEFHMSYLKENEKRRELTNAAFNRFSGGEKAMAMYVPLFAAVNAQYQKATLEDHPRMIALDEAFAGVDEMNINSMFELVNSLDFDYIMNSQSLWGCYKTIRELRIAELLRPKNSDVVTVIHYLWNGKEKLLYE